MTSSRVGAKTTTCGCFTSGLILCKRGNKYANVFPVPVGDSAITSCPSKIVGIACF